MPDFVKIIALCICCSLNGCAAGPTQQEAAEMYYGEPISQDDAEAQAKAAMANVLKDPSSAQYQCEMGGKGFIGGYGATQYGWLLGCYINAKNGYGGYTGNEKYYFVFRDGQLRRAARSDGIAQQIVYDAP